MKATQPRQHHYLPRFYFDGFVDPSILKRERKSVIWVYEKGKPRRRGSPRNEARERDLYAFDDGGLRNTRTEEWFAGLEDITAPVVQRLKSWNYDLTPEERRVLALFMGTMYTRTPAARRWFEGRVAPTASQYLSEAAREPERFASVVRDSFGEGVLGFDVETLRQGILEGRHNDTASDPFLNLATIVEVGGLIAKLLFEMDWQVVHADGEQMFVTSDSPVIPAHTNIQTGLTYFWTGVEHAEVCVWFPVCRTVSIAMKRGIGSACGRLSPHYVRSANKMVMRCADQRVYSAQGSQAAENLFNRIGGDTSLSRGEFLWDGRKF